MHFLICLRDYKRKNKYAIKNIKFLKIKKKKKESVVIHTQISKSKSIKTMTNELFNNSFK
jgi:hypothetical protein